MVTVKELREQAKSEGVVGYSKMNKAELCQAVKKKYPNCEKGGRQKKSPSIRKKSPVGKKGLEKKTVKELREMAQKKGVKRRSTMKKAELVKALSSVEKGKSPVKKSPVKKSPVKKKKSPKKSPVKKSPVKKSPVKKSPVKKSPVKKKSPKKKLPVYRRGMKEAEKLELFKHPFIVRLKWIEIEAKQEVLNNVLKNGDLSNVEKVFIYGEKVNKDRINYIPSSIEKLKNLKRLTLTNTDITTLPSEIGKLTKLEFLDLSNNRKLSSLPLEIGNLKNLIALYLNYTSLKPFLRRLHFYLT